MTIARSPLREKVHAALVRRILRDELKPGARLSDSTLAGELGVSRTPVREALVRLEGEGFLEADPGRGFFVKPLAAGEVRDVYPVLWTLETMALRACPVPSAALLAELERINADMRADAALPERRIELDTRWHRTLLERCGNRYLLETLASTKAVIRRYEYAYMLDAGLIPVSTRTHEQIAAAAAEGRTDDAAAGLEENWRFGMGAVLEWLERRG